VKDPGRRLFIELYLDEDVDVLVGELLRARGFAAITTREAGQLGKSDEQQLAYAASKGMALLTHNRVDFEALARAYYEAGKAHYGIILASRHPAHEVVRRLLLILNQVAADEMQDQVRYI
jgi:predicted nuclease of predicted toxin-antitoxin system